MEETWTIAPAPEASALAGCGSGLIKRSNTSPGVSLLLEAGLSRLVGYSFYLGFQRDMGLNLWDIRFKGERIIYELSPQEAMAQYSGTDPHQATTVFLDRAFGMGAAGRH